MVVDPGGDVDLICRTLDARALSCRQIWLTHSHLDHCGGVMELIRRTSAKLYGHEADMFLRGSVVSACEMFGIAPGDMEDCPEPHVLLCGGENLKLGEEIFKVFAVPGHAPGHLCFYNAQNKVLLAGDVIFADSIGRTDLPGGDYGTLISGIRNTILPLPDETRILSGHGPETTVGQERQNNPFLKGLSAK